MRFVEFDPDLSDLRTQENPREDLLVDLAVLLFFGVLVDGMVVSQTLLCLFELLLDSGKVSPGLRSFKYEARRLCFEVLLYAPGKILRDCVGVVRVESRRSSRRKTRSESSSMSDDAGPWRLERLHGPASLRMTTHPTSMPPGRWIGRKIGVTAITVTMTAV
ncbi:hypothetical protein GCM10009847_25850 [Leucobacter tardus]